ncbi:MAG: hypothetical protein R2710_21545 [Acidimicrobiales bacterium]
MQPDGTLKLLNAGLAGYVDDSASIFQPDEQAQRPRPVVADDVFSLGALGWWLQTGLTPDKPGALGAPSTSRRALRRALDLDPGERQWTVREFLYELENTPLMPSVRSFRATSVPSSHLPVSGPASYRSSLAPASWRCCSPRSPSSRPSDPDISTEVLGINTVPYHRGNHDHHRPDRSDHHNGVVGGRQHRFECRSGDYRQHRTGASGDQPADQHDPPTGDHSDPAAGHHRDHGSTHNHHDAASDHPIALAAQAGVAAESHDDHHQANHHDHAGDPDHHRGADHHRGPHHDRSADDHGQAHHHDHQADHDDAADHEAHRHDDHHHRAQSWQPRHPQSGPARHAGHRHQRLGHLGRLIHH